MAINIAAFGAFLLRFLFLDSFFGKHYLPPKNTANDRHKLNQPIVNKNSGEHALRGSPAPSCGNSIDRAIADYTKWLAIFTMFLVLATIGLFVSGERNVGVARRSAEAAQSSADAVMQSGSAQLWMDEVTVHGIRTQPSKMKLTFTVRNFGNSPDGCTIGRHTFSLALRCHLKEQSIRPTRLILRTYPPNTSHWEKR